jgi:hypothetical protein
MAIKHGLFLPQGFTGELAGFQDPAAAWQALTNYAQAADECGYDTKRPTMMPSPCPPPSTRF